MKIDKSENPDFLNDYIFYLKVVKGRSQRTIDEYYLDIRMFLRYIRMVKEDKYSDFNIEDIPIRDFDVNILKSLKLSDIYAYEFFLADERNNENFARARKTSAIRSLFTYLTKNVNVLEENPVNDIEMPAVKKALPKYLSLEESIRLLANINSDYPQRDYCILTLFLNCGMRLSELVGLNINHIDLKERRMRLLGKGNKERIVYINDACINAISDYLDVREDSPIEPNALFLSKFKKRISKRRVQQIVEKCLKDASLDGMGYSTHKLRHTAATLMYQHGNVDTLVLKEILGHASISTTEIYTHIANKDLKNAADNSPLANLKKKK